MKTKITIVIAILTFCIGCGSGLRYIMKSRAISIITEPTGAQVHLVNPFSSEEIWIGSTPLSNIKVPVITGATGDTTKRQLYAVFANMDSVAVIIKKEGYKTFSTRLGVKEDEVLEHKIELEPLK